MSSGSSRSSRSSRSSGSPRSLLAAALSIFAEPLVAGARVVVVAGAPHELGAHLHALGARSVHAYDPAAGELDVRDGAFDVAIVPDLGRIEDPDTTVRRLRRVVGTRGAIVALARARTPAEGGDHAEGETETETEVDATFGDVAPAAFEYAQLYDLFALQFEHVAMAGVLPFAGIVFAELGTEEEPAVSVDTRLGEGEAPRVFVVVASQEPADVEPYAIVQVPVPERDDAREPEIVTTEDPALVAAFAAAQLRANTLEAALDDATRLLDEQRAAQSRRGDERVERMTAERDAILARATALEGLVAEQQQALVTLERRFMAAEQQMLERDDRAAALQGELDALRREGDELAAPIDAASLAELVARAERAEAALALHVADLAHVAEAHATETASLEAQLRERARVIADMEKELARREHLVRELVGSLEEAREEQPANGVRFETAIPPTAVDPDELGRLRRKIDELALEIARRDGELVAREWRLAELEAAAGRATGSVAGKSEGAGAGATLERELASARDELDALRQALAQEHQARVAAESGEELARARAELARQAALLDQIRARS